MIDKNQVIKLNNVTPKLYIYIEREREREFHVITKVTDWILQFQQIYWLWSLTWLWSQTYRNRKNVIHGPQKKRLNMGHLVHAAKKKNMGHLVQFLFLPVLMPNNLKIKMGHSHLAASWFFGLLIWECPIRMWGCLLLSWCIEGCLWLEGKKLAVRIPIKVELWRPKVHWCDPFGYNLFYWKLKIKN